MFRWILSGVGRTTVSINKEKSRSFFMRSRWLTLCKEAMIIAVFKVRAEMVEVKNVNSRGSAEWDHGKQIQGVSHSGGQRGGRSDAEMGMV